MTTKPKASKFRVRRDRSGSLRDAIGPEAGASRPAAVEPAAKSGVEAKPAPSGAEAPGGTSQVPGTGTPRRESEAAGSADVAKHEDPHAKTSVSSPAKKAARANGPEIAPKEAKITREMRDSKAGAVLARITSGRKQDADTTVASQPPANYPKTDAPGNGAEALSAAPARDGEVASAAQVAGEVDMDAIRKEGLTGRQLRLARRMAQKHNIAATSDFDAVRQLRLRGIDPFQRSNMLELVVPNQGSQPGSSEEPRVQLPQTVPSHEKTLPSTERLSPTDRRIREISEIQRDIARRRRRKSFLLILRLTFFVGLPTLIAAFYFYAVATPMYATKSEFLILANDGGGGGGMSGLLSGTQFATNQDAIAVQSYLQSKDAMLRLDQDVGFRSHFTQDFIDPIQRLGDTPSNEEAYKLYKKNIEIGYDPTEGVIRMEIVAADPQVSAEYSTALISYAEDRVDSLSQRKREDQLKGATEALDEAETARRDAQLRLVELQQVSNVLDPEGRIAALRQQITGLEIQIQERELQLQALLDNTRPNRAKVEGARGDIRRMQAALAQLQADMTQASEGENSLAQLTAEIQMAQADLATRDLMLQEALTQLSQTRREANSQVRYLTTSVKPVPSQDPSYPRKFENTVLAFLIFGGVYLLISLTASILREQVST